MGDRLDRRDDRERYDFDDDENEEISDNIAPKRPLITLLDFNHILTEILRLIIYAIVFIVIFFLFFDESSKPDPLNAINQLDAENQTLGEITVVGSEIVLDEMLINTSDELENHFLKTKIVISYGSQETGLEINRRLNQIYDRIRKVVSTKKITDLKYIDGQELLSLEIKTEIQKITGKVDIYNIFFRDFTVY